MQNAINERRMHCAKHQVAKGCQDTPELVQIRPCPVSVGVCVCVSGELAQFKLRVFNLKVCLTTF